MTSLSTGTALVLHDLGLAAGFGGSLFGKVALNPAVKLIPSEEQRGKVSDAAWTGYSWINALSFGTAAATWFVGRTRVSGREISRGTHQWVVVKDFLMGSTVALNAANIVAGRMLAAEAEKHEVPLKSGDTASKNMPPTAAALTRLVHVAGILNLVAAAGVIVVTGILNTSAGRSHRWSVMSRFFLP